MSARRSCPPVHDSATASVVPLLAQQPARRPPRASPRPRRRRARRAARGSRRRARELRVGLGRARRARDAGARGCPGTAVRKPSSTPSGSATSRSISSRFDSPMPKVRSSARAPRLVDAAARRDPRQHLLVHHPVQLARHAGHAEEERGPSRSPRDLEHAARRRADRVRRAPRRPPGTTPASR